jgi:hypothetical protein
LTEWKLIPQGMLLLLEKETVAQLKMAVIWDTASQKTVMSSLVAVII